MSRCPRFATRIDAAGIGQRRLHRRGAGQMGAAEITRSHRTRMSDPRCNEVAGRIQLAGSINPASVAVAVNWMEGNHGATVAVPNAF